MDGVYGGTRPASRRYRKNRSAEAAMEAPQGKDRDGFEGLPYSPARTSFQYALHGEFAKKSALLRER
jgi:hypothetical protein